MLANINYKGIVGDDFLRTLDFPHAKPQQIIIRTDKYVILIFKSGKCRVMGCKEPLDVAGISYGIKNIEIQSVTVVADIGVIINLHHLAQELQAQCMYEPELFPALRYIKYNPLCVNIFSSGKITILGLKTLDYHCLVNDIVFDIEFELLLLNKF